MLIAAVLAHFTAPGTKAAEATATYQFNLPEQSLSNSLKAIGQQATINILFDPYTVANKMAPALRATLTAKEAIERILHGTSLTAHQSAADTVLVQPPSVKPLPASQPETASRPSLWKRLRLAQADPSPTSSQTTLSSSDSSSEKSKQRIQLEEVIVTGTNIRGVRNIASPISIHTREDIDRSGAGTVQRFIQTMPENFHGGAWEGTGASGFSGGGTAVNSVAGTALNLRGLGNDSTLVLLNGRRLAPGNSGNFVDVSMIPAAPIERVEVVLDGASALYGSDAVGGVVNFIMRRDFKGIEARTRYGAVTQGNSSELQVSGVAGNTWGGGSALLSYEYFKQDALDLRDKDWVSAQIDGPFYVLPEMQRHSVFGNLEHSIGAVEVFADAVYTSKSISNWSQWLSTFQGNFRSDSDAYNATAGLRVPMLQAHKLEFSASYARSETDRNTVNLANGSLFNHGDLTTTVSAFDGKLTGDLFALPAGAVSYAAGLHYRDETFRNFNLLANRLTFENDRELWAAFTELRLPIIGAHAQDSAVLELTLAGRYEDYRDIGDTFDPKIGLIWSPSPDIRFRGTWGTSFKAPLLNDLNPVYSQVAVLNAFDPRTNGNAPVFLLFGGNPDLVPEKSESWTVGADWEPRSLPRLKGRITFYDIAYSGRITDPQLAFGGIVPNPNLDALRFETLLARFITRNPTAAQLQAHVANTTQYSDFSGIPGGVDLSAVPALVDYRLVNLSSVDTRGLDVGLSYAWELGAASLTTGIDGTYIFDLDNELAPGVPIIHAVDTVFSPADLKLRANAGIRKGGFNAALFVNFTDGYTDSRGGANVPIDSWTTLDLSLDYRFDEDQGISNGLSISIGANNLTDEPPPFIRPLTRPMAVFDGANADVRGRFVYAQIAKRF